MGLGKPGRLRVDQLTITVELGPAPDAATPSGEKDGALFQTKGASRRAIRSRNACSTAGQSFSWAGASFRAALNAAMRASVNAAMSSAVNRTRCDCSPGIGCARVRSGSP